MQAGKVITQAKAMLRMVFAFTPERFAHIVPATPDESTCVVLTGNPNTSAIPMVLIATNSAEAPWP